MKYRVIKKDGTTEEITADNWRQVPPVNQFFNVVIKAGRKVDDVIQSVQMTEVVTIEHIDEEGSE